MKVIDADVTTTYKQIGELKGKLKSVIATYKYLLDKSSSHKIDKAIKE